MGQTWAKTKQRTHSKIIIEEQEYASGCTQISGYCRCREKDFTKSPTLSIS